MYCMYAGGANFTSLFFMNVYRIYISLLFDLFSPLCWWFDKKGKRYLIYICMIYICMFIDKKGGEIFDGVYFIFLFYNKKEEKDFCFMHVYLLVYAFIYLFSLMHFIEHLIVYWYAWVKGELLWSLSLIHAYITPWVLSSSKRGRLLARRPIALVLMMINSYSYVLMILCLFSLRFVIKILVGV